MPAEKTQRARAHTELRRQDRPEDNPQIETGADAPVLKPRTPEDRLPGGDDDDLFNDMPV
jgi:hypothetical protein